MNEGTAFTKQP